MRRGATKKKKKAKPAGDTMLSDMGGAAAPSPEPEAAVDESVELDPEAAAVNLPPSLPPRALRPDLLRHTCRSFSAFQAPPVC